MEERGDYAKVVFAQFIIYHLHRKASVKGGGRKVWLNPPLAHPIFEIFSKDDFFALIPVRH
jgi:hypothetical protein